MKINIIGSLHLLINCLSGVCNFDCQVYIGVFHLHSVPLYPGVVNQPGNFWCPSFDSFVLNWSDKANVANKAGF